MLVNNAASFYAGYFEELTQEQFDRQLATTLIGPMNVTRAVLPIMRKQRSGHIISISSLAGIKEPTSWDSRRSVSRPPSSSLFFAECEATFSRHRSYR